jgi:hypothetical protein
MTNGMDLCSILTVIRSSDVKPPTDQQQCQEARTTRLKIALETGKRRPLRPEQGDSHSANRWAGKEEEK